MNESNFENNSSGVSGAPEVLENSPEPITEPGKLSPEISGELDKDANNLEMTETSNELENILPAVTENALLDLDRNLEIGNKKIKDLESITSETQTNLSRVRDELGLPPTEEKPSSIESYEKELSELRQQKEIFEAQKKDFKSKLQEFKEGGTQTPEIDIKQLWEEAMKDDPGIEKKAEEERDKLMQEKLDKLFDEFQALDEKDQINLILVGVTINGSPWQSNSVGAVSPENAKELAKGFKEGKKDLAYFAGKLGKFVGMMARAVWEFAKGIVIGLRNKK